MKLNFRKIAVFAAVLFGFAGIATAAPMNPKYGYGDIAWGSTLAQIKMKGYELEPMEEDFVASEKSMYKEDISVYNLLNKKDKFIVNTAFYFSSGKLFQVVEVLNKTMTNPSKLGSRYGKFSPEGIHQASNDKNLFYDFVFSLDGTLQNASCLLHIGGDSVEVSLFDFSMMSKINRHYLSLAGKATIADNLYEFTNGLLKNTDKSKKTSMAFVALTSDAKNKLVENYVTDAVTQSVFETGNVKIIERANLEKILEEQKFQAGGLVDDNSAKAIGKIAGVDYVCYGDMKDIGNEITVNARIVDVETGEVLAISRGTVMKDKYLKDYAVAQKKAQVEQERKELGERIKRENAEKVARSKWEVSINRNEFDEYTTYTFTCPTTTGQFLFVGYDKYDNKMYSVVRAGICWSKNPDKVDLKYAYSQNGFFDLKGDDGRVYKTINFNPYSHYGTWSKKTGWKSEFNNSDFCFTYDKTQNIQELIKIFASNKVVTVRSDEYDYVKRFETEYFWEVLSANGIAREELAAAINNEKF